MPGDNIQLANDFAEYYDQSVAKNNWTGPQIIFDLIKSYIQPHSKILDLGIGTGESSTLFYQNGHTIFGVDGSARMLEQCKKKNITEKLLLVDLERENLPFADKYFNVAISNGVFHLIYPIKNIFTETTRALKPKGFFTFTFDEADETDGYIEISPGIWESKTASGVYTYKYDNLYIERLLQKNQYIEINRTKFLAFQNNELKKDFYFTAILAQLE